MKASIIFGLFFLSIISCSDTRTEIKYNKSFFLGEESFLLEGGCIDKKPYTPFNSVVVRPDTLYGVNTEWEIYGEKISENKFQVLIDIMANGISIEEEINTENKYYTPRMFPDGFPAILLNFYFNESYMMNSPYYREYRDKDYYYYFCDYVYVAEPIDLSGTESGEAEDMFGHYNYTHYYDYNFPKKGWYKIIRNYHRPFGNGQDFSSPKNNYFEDNW